MDSKIGGLFGHDYSEKTDALFKIADLDNIKETLPLLYPEQQEDVYKAELRFQVGKGRLFTNGTGTGKTFVGLGIIKRFILQGKTNILIVVPTDQKAKDWIEEAELFDIDVYLIKGINDPGRKVRVTTYANFYQNEPLTKEDLDLVEYDESHYLLSNQKGEDTVYLQQHKKIVKTASAAKAKAQILAGEPPNYKRQDKDENYNFKVAAWRLQVHYYATKINKKTKVVFLSATPFPYHKTIKYADGCLWDIEEKLSLDPPPPPSGYNSASGFDEFLIENFGYRMKNNKLTIPETGVDQSLMEREFFEKAVEQNIISTRVLDLPFDYSRHFVTLDSNIGDFINKGMTMFYSKEMRDRYPILCENIGRKYNYLFVNQLLEAVKAQEIYERINQHLALNRKVILFHSYNKSEVPHPFHFDPDKMLAADSKHDYYKLKREIQRFQMEFYEYVNLDLGSLLNTIDAIKTKFPEALFFNGTVSKKKKNENIRKFNDDKSGCNLILIQEKAGREGISLHDRYGIDEGGMQRATLILGLPVVPVASIQIEGRTYRSKLMSNAIYEYITLQSNFEQIAFAKKIAERSRTAENLGMGNLARDLESAFKEGYLNSSHDPPSLNQGVGGKEADRVLRSSDPFDKAISYYYGKQKKNSKNKSFEGVDFFATPEPLGYKMFQWLNVQNNERCLEPSAGDGAIARWFNPDTDNNFIEPSYSLLTKLILNVNGNTINDTFENHRIVNKYNAIAMNPPFGTQSKTAFEHVKKAVKHLTIRGDRPSLLLAIVPNGASMNKRLDEFYESKEFRKYQLTGEIFLPSVCFSRAGTNVMCKIIRIHYIGDKDPLPFRTFDFTGCESINDFFDEIKELEF